ncbi:bifunctional metallophosphatase/5'-nucleotidase [bacterium]|nr:bifunctional metallophosphatase/5'-nucleotidase [bacterium]
MKKFFPNKISHAVIFSSVLILTALCSLLPAVEVTFLYWSDRHSLNLTRHEVIGADTITTGGAAVLSGMVNKLRGDNSHTMVMVAGGEFGGSPISLLTEGLSQVKILNRIGIDAFLPGNHEFDHGWRSLLEVMGEAEFQVLLSNVIRSDNLELLFPPDTVFNLQDVLVGVTGLIYPNFSRSVIRDGIIGIKEVDPIAVVNDFIAKRRETCDLLIAMTYFGWEMDSIFAAEVNGLDIIIGGRAKEPLDPPRKVNGTIIVQSGANGRRLGRLIVDVDTSRGGVNSFRNSLLRIVPGVAEPDEKLEKLMQKLEKKHTRHLEENIGVLQTNWNFEIDKPTNLIQLVADIIRSVSPSSQLAVLSNSSLAKGLSRGPIRELDIWEICPYDYPIVAFQISGRELKEIISRQLRSTGEFLTWSGLKVVARGGEIISLRVDDSPVEDIDEFAVLTTGSLWGNVEDYLAISSINRPRFYLPDTNLRNEIIEAVKFLKIISFELDDRWIVE